MAKFSPRVACPHCCAADIRPLAALSLDGWVDYFSCRGCGHAWSVPKHEDGPVHDVTVEAPQTSHDKQA